MSNSYAAWNRAGYDAMMLGYEAWTVIALRTMRAATGHADTERETRRMVDEKWDAAFSLPFALWSNMLDMTPLAMTNRTLSHYGKTVRANRRRLTRS
ncbi:hypothetical protein [Sphingomonas sp.]